MDGDGIEVCDVDDHAVLYSIKVEASHVFFHLCDNITFSVFEGQSDIGRFGSISFLDVLF